MSSIGVRLTRFPTLHVCALIDSTYIASYKHTYFKHSTSRTSVSIIIYLVFNRHFYEKITKS
ncbi:hypothetical protein Hanom_Chr07g00658881 [Helianthus anomalus]